MHMSVLNDTRRTPEKAPLFMIYDHDGVEASLPRPELSGHPKDETGEEAGEDTGQD
jgi:hypothetical protein